MDVRLIGVYDDIVLFFLQFICICDVCKIGPDDILPCFVSLDFFAFDFPPLVFEQCVECIPNNTLRGVKASPRLPPIGWDKGSCKCCPNRGNGDRSTICVVFHDVLIDEG